MTTHHHITTALRIMRRRAGVTLADLAPRLGYASASTLSRALREPERCTFGLVYRHLEAVGATWVDLLQQRDDEN